LVILDESKSSESAKKLSLNLAKTHKASLTGIGILDAPGITMPEAIPLGGVAFKVDLDEKLLEKAQHRIHDLEQKFINYCASQQVSASVIDATGIPSEEIEYFSTEFDALVIGKDANFHFSSAKDITISVKQILKDSPRPIFVTSPKLPNQDNPHVLIAFDGTLASSKALHMAILMGILKGKILHIASVSENEEKVRYWVSNALKLCKNHDLKAHVHPIVSVQKPSTALLELMTDLHPSLIVMGAYGHSGIRAFFMGSCAKDLLQETDIPLFVFH
jgi:nucleotide-binding universal stress UspA family protein